MIKLSCTAMKSILTICFIFLISTEFVCAQKRTLSNGRYLVKLDTKYKEIGLNDFEFSLENDFLEMTLANKLEKLEVIWIDQMSFKVIGYTEPSNPTTIEREILKKSTILFQIEKIVENEYFFSLSDKDGKTAIYSGKFVKI